LKKRKSVKVKVITVLTVLCALIALISALPSTLLSLFLSYKFNIDTRDAASIGIIGEADGPTVVFVSGQFSSGLFAVIFAMLTVLGIIYLVIAKRAENNN